MALRGQPRAYASILQHTSAPSYVSKRQQTSAYAYVNGLERTASRCDVGDHHGAEGVVRPHLYKQRKKGKKKEKSEVLKMLPIHSAEGVVHPHVGQVPYTASSARRSTYTCPPACVVRPHVYIYASARMSTSISMGVRLCLHL
jgi:hypothetical protein